MTSRKFWARRGQRTRLASDDAWTLTEVPPLPFLDGVRRPPPCTQHDALFELAARDDRKAIHDLGFRAHVIRAEALTKTICHQCPVLDGCRAYALTTRQRWGIWGGTNPAERSAWAHRHNDMLGEVVDMTSPDMRRKFADVDTLPLFDESEARTTTSQETKPRKRTQKAVAKGNCPECTTMPVGIIVLGEHWVWRPHSIRTWGNEKRLCRASSVAICVAPEREGVEYSGKGVRCPHDDEGPHGGGLKVAA